MGQCELQLYDGGKLQGEGLNFKNEGKRLNWVRTSRCGNEGLYWWAELDAKECGMFHVQC